MTILHKVARMAAIRCNNFWSSSQLPSMRLTSPSVSRQVITFFICPLDTPIAIYTNAHYLSNSFNSLFKFTANMGSIDSCDGKVLIIEFD